MTLFALATLDYIVVGVYLAGMLWLGALFSRRQNTEEEYFLASRSIPWFAIGLSIIATLMSSLTYVSEPGEVWKSGITNMAGKMLAIPLEMALVYWIFLPRITQWRYTSVYDYLGDRFGTATKRLGIVLFLWLAVAWMGFIVLVSSQILADASELDLYVVTATVGLVATLYTVAGGLRAVIWTDVVQVVLMLGGAIMTLAYVYLKTGGGPAEWFDLVVTKHSTKELPLFDANPFTRSTIFTVAASMFCWHVCTHLSNQMTVQRYFSAGSLKGARRSFVIGSLTGVAINLLLCAIGLALFYFYHELGESQPEGLNPVGKEADRIFPRFAFRKLPVGLAGAWLAAMVAAAMSSIDSGINSAASVLTVEWDHLRAKRRGSSADNSTAGETSMGAVKILTLLLGLFVTLAAYWLDVLTRERNIIDMMGRSFNCFTGPLGGLFFLGLFVPRCGNRAATFAGLAGVAVSISLAFGQELFGLKQAISFTWVLPVSLAVTMAIGAAVSLISPLR